MSRSPAAVPSRSRYLPVPTSSIRPTQTQDDSEAEESDFPPCLVGNCTPIMSRSPAAVPSRSRYLPAATSGSEKQLTISGKKEPQSQHRRLPNPGLGQMNVVNTTATALNKKGNRTSHGRPSLKRQGSKAEDLSLANERPLKTRHLMPRDRDNNLQSNISMQRDVAGIKETLEDMASEVKEEIACIKENLEELSYEVREGRDNISYMLAEILAEIRHDRD